MANEPGILFEVLPAFDRISTSIVEIQTVDRILEVALESLLRLIIFGGNVIQDISDGEKFLAYLLLYHR